MEQSLQYILFSGAFLCIITWLYARGSSRGLPLPPGPKRLPVIGNLFDMPSTFQFLTFDKWCKQYGTLESLWFWHQWLNSMTGDIVYIEVLWNKFLILGSTKRTNHLLAERSAIYSDRTQQPIVEL